MVATSPGTDRPVDTTQYFSHVERDHLIGTGRRPGNVWVPLGRHWPKHRWLYLDGGMPVAHRPAFPPVGTPVITDGGLETWLVFDCGIELPSFAAYPLVGSHEGRSALTR